MARHSSRTTEVETRPWESYVPSRSSDAAVARELVRQIAQIHRAGVVHCVHWDMFPKNVLFRPPCSVAIIDFEKAEFTTDREARDADYLICAHFARHENTRGIALGMLRAMPVSACGQNARNPAIARSTVFPRSLGTCSSRSMCATNPM